MAVSPRAEKLKQLAGSMPGADQDLQNQQQAAHTLQIQSAVKQAPGPMSTGQQQQLGAAAATQQGQSKVQQAQQSQVSQQLLGQESLADKSQQQRQKAFEQQMSLTGKQQDYAQRISKLSRNTSNKLLDQQLQFKVDQAGDAILTDSQMLDWVATNARNQEEYQEYVQSMEHAYSRELQVLEQAQKVLTQSLEQNATRTGKELTREQQLDMTKKKQAMDKAIQQKQNDAANRQAKYQSIGTIGGAVAGGLLGGPAGAAAGASVGGGLANTLLNI